ncbi:MAG TPA: class I SAM-dependent methyltransferase [Blastocatellia bacterium]|nr:class I SAM-dependent methyltransferase [Blastocatellia bacterium]
MKKSYLFLGSIILFFAATPGVLVLPAQTPQSAAYEFRRNHDPDGIGKFYMGREIAHVMGHLGARWLERDDRLDTERPDEVVKNFKLKATDVVADIGAGTGYFTFRLSPIVNRGKVFAVDIQPEMLALMETRKKAMRAENVVLVQGTETDTKLPAAVVDLAFMVDAYHEFSYPREMMQSIVNALKPGGRVVLIEYRGEDPSVPIKRVHKMTVAQARKELEAVGLVWKETKNFLPHQHFIVFAKPEAAAK